MVTNAYRIQVVVHVGVTATMGVFRKKPQKTKENKTQPIEKKQQRMRVYKHKNHTLFVNNILNIFR